MIMASHSLKLKVKVEANEIRKHDYCNAVCEQTTIQPATNATTVTETETVAIPVTVTITDRVTG